MHTLRALDHSNLEQDRLYVIASNEVDVLLQEDTYRIYGQILQKHCSSAIDDDCWVLPFSDGIRHAKVSFTDIMASPEELRLIKAYIVDTLSHYSSPSTCAGKVRNLKFLFQFLHERHHSVKAISTPLINLFRVWLDEKTMLSADKKNLIESDLQGFIMFLRGHSLVQSGPIAIPRPRVVAEEEVTRAPDKCVLEKLDTYFLDFANPIPTAYRCLYVLLRLIPGRNQEVLSVDIDCFSVTDDLLKIQIPTYKETANHEAYYQTHYRLATEYPECILLQCLEEQRIYACLHQSDIENPKLRNKLMVSPRAPSRVVSASEFNTYLKHICEDLGVTDALGEAEYITMYSLRHANGSELAFFPEVTQSEYTRVFAHTSDLSDDSYAYASKHDELLHTAPFTQLVRNALSPQDNTPVRYVSSKRLKSLQVDPETRLIGNGAVCQQKSCIPQFNRCVFCEEYSPNPQFIAAAEQCCEQLRQRIGLCKDRNDCSNLQFNEEQLSVYMTFIRRAETR